MSDESPILERICVGDVCFSTDRALRERSGIAVAFTERGGGVSLAEYASLNLAGHVGDDPAAVDANRDHLLAALGCAGARGRLVTAEQVHGTTVEEITEDRAGEGAFALGGRPPVPGTDVMFTRQLDLPILMLYADCVPVVLVCEAPRMVAVVHAGWRGAYASLPGIAASVLAGVAGCAPAGLSAYVGPHIGECCYEVEEAMLSHFGGKFGTIAAVDGCLDLGAVVPESLMAAGVRPECVARVNECTLDHVDRYFSYRAGNITGRHGALAVITKVG